MAIYRGVPWRFLITDLFGTSTCWADGLLTNRKITFNLNAACEIDCSIWPDNPRVNLLAPDGYRKVAQTNRLIYAFRREDPDPGHAFPWVCRAAGIVMTPEDQGDPDVPLTTLAAYDPWKYLEARPFVRADSSFPPAGGYIPGFAGLTGDQVVGNALLWTINAEPPTVGGTGGNGCFIDAGPLYGGTAFWGTTTPAVIETTAPSWIAIQQGASVADVWTEICNSGVLDIILYPIYDPINRPGYTHDLAIYNVAGADRPDAIFGWDQMRRSLKGIDRLHSAVPGDYFNKGVFFSGAGGFPSGPIAKPAQINDFLVYWTKQFSPTQPDVPIDGNIVLQLLRQAMVQAKQGKRTLTLDPTPERAPVPLNDYYLGDRVPVWATNRLRTPITSNLSPDTSLQDRAGFRVTTIPITITDDGIEEVTGMVLDPDYRITGSIVTGDVPGPGGATIFNGGSGFIVGDTGIFDQGNLQATYTVQAVGGAGDVTLFTVTAGGLGYEVDLNPVSAVVGGIQPGAGIGFKISVTAIA